MALLLAAGPAGAAMNLSDQLDFADGLYVRGLYELAAAEYAAIAAAPSFDRMDTVLFRLGECRRRLGDRTQAEKSYRRLIAEFPASRHRPLAEFRRGELFAAAGRDAEAVDLFQVLLERDPPADIAATARYQMGLSLQALGRDADATAAFREIVDRHEASPVFSYACLSLAGALKGKGSADKEVRALYRRAAEKAPSPRAAAEALFQLGSHAFERKDYEESANAYRELLQKHPDDERAGQARLQAGWSYHNSGNPAGALQLAESALAAKETADRAAWLYLQANAQRRLDRPESAETYRMVLAAGATGELAQAAAYERSLVLFDRADYAGVLQQAADTPPAGAAEEDRMWLAAEARQKLGQTNEAASAYTGLLEKFPKSKRAPLALYRYAALCREQGRLPDASGSFRRLAKDFPKSEWAAPALLASGYCRSRLDEHEEALRDWSAVADGFPSFDKRDAALHEKALTELKLGRNDDAEATFADLLKQYPGTAGAADARYRFALLLERKDRVKDAEDQLRQALDAKPEKDLSERIRFALAAVLQKRGKPAEAADLLQGLLATAQKKNMSPALLEWLARYQLENQAHARAAKAAAALVRAAPDAAWKQIGWSLAGLAADGAGDPAKAMDAFTESIGQDARTRDGAEAALRLGELALAANDAARSESAFQRAAELAGGADLVDVRARSYYGLGRVARSRGEWEPAARYFMSVAVLFDDPELTPECLHEAAGAFGQAGRAKERDEALAELRTRYPASRWAAGQQEQP